MKTTSTPGFSPSSRSRSAGLDLVAPAGVVVHDLRLPKVSASSTSARRTCRTRRRGRLVPGLIRFAAADSIPPDPEDAKQSTSFWVWNTPLSRSRQRAYTSTNAGARW